jgi:hypothetical protein
MRPAETIPGMGVRGIKENDRGVNLAKIHCKNFCKCHSVHIHSTTIMKRK